MTASPTSTLTPQVDQASPSKKPRNEPIFAANKRSRSEPRRPTRSDKLHTKTATRTFHSTPTPRVFPSRDQPREFSRTTSTASSNSTWSGTTSTSTTNSTVTTFLTTPTTSIPSSSELLGHTEDKAWRPIQPVPYERRTVLVIPRNPLQVEMARLDVHFSVQWEMERLFARHRELSWDNVSARDLEALAGPAEHAMSNLAQMISDMRSGSSAFCDGSSPRPPVSSSMGTIARRRRMLVEMDREEVSIRSNDLRGVLNNDPDWSYGGKIAYNIIVKPNSIRAEDCIRMPDVRKSEPEHMVNPFLTVSKGPSDRFRFSMTLCPPDIPGKSFRLARRFGSRRIVSFKLRDLKSASDRERVKELFVGRQFELMGRSYRAIWAIPDGDSVFAMELKCCDATLAIMSNSDSYLPSFADLWSSESCQQSKLMIAYNDMSKKPSQAMAK